MSVSEQYGQDGIYAYEDQQALQRLLSLGFQPQIIVDVGASDGAWSKDIDDMSIPAEYYLFEPLSSQTSEYREEMQRSLQAHPHFHLQECALGAEIGEVSIKILPEVVASTTLDLEGYSGDYRTIVVPRKTIDSLVASQQIPVPNLLKIDTQGSELEILKGAINILEQIDVLLLETWLYRGYGRQTPLLNELMAWLEPFGFRLWDMGGTYREGSVLASVDCWFVNTRLEFVPDWYYAK